MSPLTASSQVFDAIQNVKTGAPAFCTNFFAAPAKLDGWIDHRELFCESFDGTAFFFRKDQDFWHWYFCAAEPAALSRQSPNSPILKSEPMVVDLIGKEGMLDEMLKRVEAAGFRRYVRLVRLARPADPGPLAPPGGPAVTLARKVDVPAVMALLRQAFDPYADQLPGAYELEDAIQAGQVLAVRVEEGLAAFLHYETQGVTSTVRYWAVAERFRASGFGSALIRHYFASQSAVRRFVLWVAAQNENALEKYRHYGYTTDGLMDHVLVNDKIRA